MGDSGIRLESNSNRVETQIHVYKVVVFELSKNNLRVEDPIDDLLDQIIGVCLGDPEFLRPEDAKRYIFFLKELRNWQAPANPIKWSTGPNGPAMKRGPQTIRAGEHPIAKLSLLLPYWVMSYFDGQHRLMPHFALDAANFIHSMLGGFRGVEPVNWRTEPLIWPEGRGLIDFTPSFKRDFTRATCLVVRAVVPENAMVITEFYNSEYGMPVEARLQSGTVFDFRVMRCHLSEGLAGEGESVRIKKPLCVANFDIAEDFRFWGCIVGVGGEREWSETQLPKETHLAAALPFRWITHEVSYEGEHPPYTRKLIPCPTWETSMEA